MLKAGSKALRAMPLGGIEGTILGDIELTLSLLC